MALFECKGKSGSDGNFYCNVITESQLQNPVTINIDFPIRYIEIYTVTKNGVLVVSLYDANTDTYKLTTASTFENSVQGKPAGVSISGNTIIYTAPSANYKADTRIIVF